MVGAGLRGACFCGLLAARTTGTPIAAPVATSKPPSAVRLVISAFPDKHVLLFVDPVRSRPFLRRSVQCVQIVCINDAVRVSLLGQESLTMAGKVCINGIARDDRIETGHQALFGTQ